MSETWIVDASVGLEWCAVEVDSERAVRLLDALKAGAELVVPDLFFVECGNALWKRVMRKDISAEVARECLEALLSLPLRVVPMTELAAPGLALATACEATVYDACYVALAERERGTLITADARLVTKVKDRPCRVKVLADLAADDLDL